jgi:hypothetical protein
MISPNQTAIMEPSVWEMRQFLELKDVMLKGFDLDKSSKEAFINWGRRCNSALSHLEKMEKRG